MPPKAKPTVAKAKPAAKPAAKPSAPSQAVAPKSASSAKPASARPASSRKPVKLEPIELEVKALIKTVCDTPSPRDARWSSVIDNDEQLVARFIRHRGFTYLHAMQQTDIEPERIRSALIYAIKTGNNVIFDLMGAEDSLLGLVEEACNKVNPTLWDDLISKKLLENEKFMYLVTDPNDDEFKSYQFVDKNIDNFRVIFLSTNKQLADNLLEVTKPYKLV